MNYQWRKWFTFCFVALFWSSCSDDKDYEILTSEDVLPQAQGNYEYSEDTSIPGESVISAFEERLKLSLPEIYFEEKNILKKREMLFMPDRLGYSERNEAYFMHDSIPFHLIEWTFNDSLKTVNAFYNWLDCFGHKCNSIRIDEEKNGSKEAFLIWISNTQISYLASVEHINRRTWQKVLFGEEKNIWNYIIHQAPRGKMNWIVSATKED